MAFNFKLNLRIVGDTLGVDVSNLDFEYKFTRSNKLGESSCNISIYNLNEDTKNMILNGKNVSMSLSGGWEDELPALPVNNPVDNPYPVMFAGTVISTQEDNFGIDKKFIINCTNLRGSFKNQAEKTRVKTQAETKKEVGKSVPNTTKFRNEWNGGNIQLSLSYDDVTPTPLAVILQEIATILGLAPYGVEQISHVLLGAFSSTGSPKNVMDQINKILAPGGFEVFVDEANLIVYNTRTPFISIPVVYFSDNPLEEKGTLVNISKITDNTKAGNKNEENKNRYKIDCIYHHSLVPNSAVTISTKIAKGAFLIDKIMASGSTRNDQNFATLEVSGYGL